MRRLTALSAAAVLALSACGGAQPSEPASETPSSEAPAPENSEGAPETQASTEETQASETAEQAVTEFTTTEHGEFNEGWAMEFLPDGKHLLITERVGTLKIRNQESGEVREISGVPEVHHAGQAGLHDVVLGPTFEDDGTIYLSWVSPGGKPHGVVGTATLDVEGATLSGLKEIWQQDEVDGNGHFSLRMLIQDDHLHLTSGDRQKFDPAQDHGTNLGKVLRLNLDGTPATDNPFDVEGAEASFFTIGHRNPLGIAADSQGQIWVSEMGPKGGDELNLIVPGQNYGWPEASMGEHYDGAPITDHAEGDGFEAPKAYWVPSISPGSLAIYSGELFTGWQDSALLGGLSGETLVRVALDGDKAEIADDWNMGARIRAVEEAPDGSIWLLEDEAGGRLLELRPA